MEWTENERSASVSVHTAAEGGLRPHHLRWNHQINRTELFSNPPTQTGELEHDKKHIRTERRELR